MEYCKEHTFDGISLPVSKCFSCRIATLESQLTEAQELLLIEYEKVNCLDSEIDNLKDRLAEREWISVDEGLPEQHAFVLGWMPTGRIHMVEWDGLHWGEPGDDHPIGYHITHWMSLPAAPTGAKE